MRMRWYDRVLIILSALLLIAMGALLFMTGVRSPQPAYDFGLKLIQAFIGLTAVHWVRSGAWYAISLLVLAGLVLFGWGVRQLISLLPKRKEEEPYFNASDMQNGRLSISLQALEHLVTKCVEEHPEFSDSIIKITGDEEKATVNISASLATGISMPKATAALQKEIIEYLSDCAGIDVTGVNVIVDDTKHNPAIPSPKAVYALPEQVTVKAEPVQAFKKPAADETIVSFDSRPAAEDRAATSFDESPAHREEPTIEESIESVAEARLETPGETVGIAGAEAQAALEAEALDQTADIADAHGEQSL